ncbi:LOW QUALITY PROTEIN: hypothetical protein CFOL_v3_33588, partial [Cephalotus follicularis]
MQPSTLKKYPAQLSLTAWVNCVGEAQSALFTMLIQPKAAACNIKLGINLWCIIYSVSGVNILVQLWCTKKGPVFVTMFSPLTTVMVAVLAFFVLGEKLH